MVKSTEALPKEKVPLAAIAAEKESTPRRSGQGRLRLRKAPPSSAVTTYDGDLASNRSVPSVLLHAPPSIRSSPRGAASSEVSRFMACSLRRSITYAYTIS
jgi:hypothetical protein